MRTAPAAAPHRQDRAVLPPLSVAFQLESPAFATFLDLFAPLANVEGEEVYTGRIYLQRWERRWAKPDARERVTLVRALAAHVAAGVFYEPQSYRDDKPSKLLRAVGIQPPPADPVRVLNLDLDGGVDPAEVVGALHEVVGDRMMVTSSSGRPGHFRALVPIQLLAVEHSFRLGRALVRSLGFPVQKASVEVFPAPNQNGRVPFGMGGCDVFDLDLREHAWRHPLTLASELASLEPVDLFALVQQIGGVASLGPVQETHRNASTPSKRIVTHNAKRIVTHDADVTTAIEAAELWRFGVSGRGERDRALYVLTVDCLRHGMTELEAVAKLRDWIDGGGLRRSDGASTSRGLQHELVDVSRRVRTVYANPPQLGRPKPLHLTRVEVLRLVTHVDAIEGDDRLLAFLVRMLPRFKPVGDLDLPVHRDTWHEAGGKAYVAMREASGLFREAPRPMGHDGRRRPRYLSALEAGNRGLEPYPIAWRCSFRFDVAVPRQSCIPVRGRTPTQIATSARLVAKRVRRGK